MNSTPEGQPSLEPMSTMATLSSTEGLSVRYLTCVLLLAIAGVVITSSTAMIICSIIREQAITMGNGKSRRKPKEPKTFFEREKKQQMEKDDEKKKPTSNARSKPIIPETVPFPAVAGPSAVAGHHRQPTPTHQQKRAYDEEAIEMMRRQLNQDTDAFLLNNILLSVQFFENYEKTLLALKKQPVLDVDVQINENLAQHYKHVYTPDKLQEAVHENVRFLRRHEDRSDRNTGIPEPFHPLRMYIVYDNIEASEPGEESDYSTIIDAPYYKMLIEDTNEPGFVKLRTVEILKNPVQNNFDVTEPRKSSDITRLSDKESKLFDNSGDEDDNDNSFNGEKLKSQLRNGLQKNSWRPPVLKRTDSKTRSFENIKFVEAATRARSGSSPKREEGAWKRLDNNVYLKFNKSESESLGMEEDVPMDRRPSKSLKMMRFAQSAWDVNCEERRPSGVRRHLNGAKSMVNIPDISIQEDDVFETAKYSSLTMLSSYDSDYGYMTITNATTPRPLGKPDLDRIPDNTSALPNDCFTPVRIKINPLSENFDDEELDEANFHKNLFKKVYYLNGTYFMENFIHMFMFNIGNAVGFSKGAIDKALTQGASIYCDSLKHNILTGHDIMPSVYAAWCNVANEWLIRQRRIITNPRTNFKYQWPTPNMIQKARRLGCLLLPIGYRPTRGTNEDQIYQWKICFPAVERYFELCLAHSQVRCFMFTLCLMKTFISIDESVLGLEAGHIKAHLFAQCEDNYARWPEDRLGETLRNFLKSLYDHISKGNLPCYFITSCNLFKGIPRSKLLKTQRIIANILESPVVHVLYALHNLHYAKSDFYPVIDYMKLYKILISENSLAISNPQLSKSTSSISELEEDSDDEYKQSKMGFWEQAKSKDQGYKWHKQRHKQLTAQNQMATQLQPPKTKSYGINTSIIIPKHLDSNKRRLILEFFIPHFIAMADKSDEFGATKQGLIYLEHANRLCTILCSEPSGELLGKDYYNTLKEKIVFFNMKVLRQRRMSYGYNGPSTSQPHDRNPARRIPPTPTEGIDPKKSFTYAEVHLQNQDRRGSVMLQEDLFYMEESRL